MTLDRSTASSTPSPITPPLKTPEAPTTKTARMPVPLTDEEEALRSLDDTMMRPMPDRPTIWSDTPRQPQENEPKRSRLPLVALVSAVSVISFVAGGVTARLSSQMPVLFPQQPTATESTASYVPETTEEETEELVQQQEETTSPQDETDEHTAPPSYDTGYDDTTYNSPQNTDSDTDSTSWQWDLDENGTDSIRYDSDNEQVTLDHNGYTLSVPIGDLIDNTDDLYTLFVPDSTESRPTSPYGYDNGTGYDTEEDRDRNAWGPHSSYGWS